MRALVLAVRLRDPEGPGVSPREPVAGLPLLLRLMLTVQAAGATSIAVAVPLGERAPAEEAAADARCRAMVTVYEVAAAANAVPDEALGPGGSVLVAHAEVLAPHELYRTLLARISAGADGAVLVDGDVAPGPLALDRALLSGVSWADLADADAWRDRPGVEALPVERPLWWADARTVAGRRAAAHALFEACRKPVDGFVSRHLNRHVSLRISRALVGTPLTPNQATVITFGVGLVAAWFATLGGYWASLTAAALMQLNSILDGVDGELARVRFQGSKLGQWLDTLGDDASNLIFWLALSVSAPLYPHGRWLQIAGWVAAGTTAAVALLYYRELAQKGTGDLNALSWSFEAQRPVGFTGYVVLFFRYLLKQDAFIFLLLVAALFGGLHAVLPLAAAGGIITLCAAAARTVVRALRSP